MEASKVKTESSKLVEISHHKIYDLARRCQANHNLRVSMHLPMGMPGGLSFLENSLLVSLLFISKAKRVFEFGTYLGATTALLANSCEDLEEIITLDLPPQSIDIDRSKELDLKNKNDNDDFLRAKYQDLGSPYIDGLPENLKLKVKQIYCDSTKLDLQDSQINSALGFDVVFIDGGHDFNIVKSDTSNGMKILKNDGFIVWHDFKSTIHTDVTDFLNQFEELPVYHIPHSMIAFSPVGKYQSFF